MSMCDKCESKIKNWVLEELAAPIVDTSLALPHDLGTIARINDQLL